MAHYIEFRGDACFEIERAGETTTCHCRAGEQCQAHVRCYVVREKGRYIEVADIELEDGVIRGFPCSHFLFLDSLD